MWLTNDGERFLRGAEADLVRGSIGIMLDQLVIEGRESDEGIWDESDAEADHSFSIPWFDNWDWRQRIWLLEQATTALLTERGSPSPSAILDATVDAVFREVHDLVVFEIAETDAGSANFSWRKSILEAATSRGISVKLRPDETDADAWLRLVTRLADAILGPRGYIKAEMHRDGDIQRTKEFLQRRGLPEDYLEMIPPLRTVDQTQLSIDRIQSLVFA